MSSFNEKVIRGLSQLIAAANTDPGHTQNVNVDLRLSVGKREDPEDHAEDEEKQTRRKYPCHFCGRSYGGLNVHLKTCKGKIIRL